MKEIKENKSISEIIKRLKKHYPQAKIILKYSNPWELLVATVLSAQCTDLTVNKVTERLFRKYKNIKDYANARLIEFEQDIKSTGFFRNKAKNIIESAKRILKDYKGKVPDTMKELINLPGVARKTANVILYNAFIKKEGIAVDTHVIRLSQRLGLTKNKDPKKIEKDLMKIAPKKQWGLITYLLIDHGRAVCNAKKPLCNQCVLNDICPYVITYNVNV